MSSKRKRGVESEEPKLPLRKCEVRFTDKTVDLRRFAYDLFVYSVAKFRVPSSCIYKCTYPENDYGEYKPCPVIFRSVIKYQIEHRYTLYEMFNSRLESNDLKIFDKVSYVCQDAIKMLVAYENLIILDEAEISLAVVCELILFLYSKNANLYLNELADLWCDWIVVQKRKFVETYGGLNRMYLISLTEAKDLVNAQPSGTQMGAKLSTPQMEQNEPLDAFFESFISYCTPYERSAKMDSLASKFFMLGSRHNLLITKTFAQKDCHERKEEVGRNKPRRAADSSRTKAPVPISKQDEDSGACALENTGLGIRPHEELLQCIGASASADAAPSQTLRGTHSRESPRHRRGSSGRQRRRTNSSLHSGVEKDFRGLSLDP